MTEMNWVEVKPGKCALCCKKHSIDGALVPMQMSVKLFSRKIKVPRQGKRPAIEERLYAIARCSHCAYSEEVSLEGFEVV